MIEKMKKRIIHLLLSLISSQKYDVDEEKEIIDSFPIPQNDYDRTYYNYKCSCRGRKKWSILLFDVAGIIIIPFLIILYSINRLILSKREMLDAVIINANNRLGVHYSYEGRIPQSIFDEYKNVEELQLNRFPRIIEGVIGLKALNTWIGFFIRHPVSGFVNLRALINLMGMNKILQLYKPKAVVISRGELNGMSSLITHFCELCGVKYINFMHGDSRAELSIAFVRFSEFYIWDKDYIEVFEWGRCEDTQYRIYTPQIYQFNLNEESSGKYYLLYVFSGNDVTGKDENANSIKDILLPLTQHGKKCKVRPHPRWSNIDYLEDVFSSTGIDIENPKSVSTKESISETEIVVGTYSTVLAEAFYGGKKVALDDMSDPQLFDNLKKRKYIMFNKEHMLLSELILGG